VLAQGDALFAAPLTWIAGATVLSPEQKDSGRQLNVLVDGERIAAVTAELPADAAQGATVVNADGLFLIPGLIDGHTHLQSVPGFTPLMQLGHPALVRAYRAQLPRSFLRYGYTTVIDLIVADPDALAVFAQGSRRRPCGRISTPVAPRCRCPAATPCKTSRRGSASSPSPTRWSS
jgi:hypothetical protein